MLSSSLCMQFNSPEPVTHTDSSTRDLGNDSSQNTPLTTTWALCNPELERSKTIERQGISQEPERGPGTLDSVPYDVIKVFELLLQPDVQNYMRAVVFQHKEQPHFQPADTSLGTSTWSTSSRHTQPSPWSQPSHHNSLPTLLELENPPTQQMSTDFIPVQDMPPSCTQYTVLTQCTPDIRSTPCTPDIQSTPCTPDIRSTPYTPDIRSTPCTPDIRSMPCTPDIRSPLLDTMMPSSHDFTLDTTPQHKNIMPATPIRRSPRKQKSVTPDTADGNTKLLAHSSVMVKREALRRAKAAAQKAHPSKMAFVLAAKLLPAIFSWEEMAASRGQGLKSKEGDSRPVLDVTRMSVLKEYVAVWCAQNGGTGGSDKEINDAVTEQISYARKKIKKAGQQLS